MHLEILLLLCTLKQFSDLGCTFWFWGKNIWFNDLKRLITKTMVDVFSINHATMQHKLSADFPS